MVFLIPTQQISVGASAADFLVVAFFAPFDDKGWIF